MLFFTKALNTLACEYVFHHHYLKKHIYVHLLLHPTCTYSAHFIFPLYLFHVFHTLWTQKKWPHIPINEQPLAGVPAIVFITLLENKLAIGRRQIYR